MTRTFPLLLTLLAALGTASCDSDRSLKLGVIAELTGDMPGNQYQGVLRRTGRLSSLRRPPHAAQRRLEPVGLAGDHAVRWRDDARLLPAAAGRGRDPAEVLEVAPTAERIGGDACSTRHGGSPCALLRREG